MKSTRYEIVPFEPIDAHYAAAVRMWNDLYPDYPETVRELKENDKTREKKYFFGRFLVKDLESGEFVGKATYGHTFWAYHPDRYYIELLVENAYGHGELEEFIYQNALPILTERGAISVEMESRETFTWYLKFLEEKGFVLKTTEFTSRMDLAQFEFDKFQPIVDKNIAAGLRFSNAAELQKTDPDFLQKYHAAINEIAKDIPWHEEMTPQPFHVFKKRWHTHKTRIEEAYIVAIDGDAYVGVTMLRKNETDPTTLFTGFTGVKRDYRRRGLAIAMKTLAYRYVIDHMQTPDGNPFTIVTENEENNPMFQINVQMGFIKQPSMLFLRKELVEVGSGAD